MLWRIVGRDVDDSGVPFDEVSFNGDFAWISIEDREKGVDLCSSIEVIEYCDFMSWCPAVEPCERLVSDEAEMTVRQGTTFFVCQSGLAAPWRSPDPDDLRLPGTWYSI